MSEHDAETSQGSETRTCVNCGADSSDRMILPAEYHGEEGWVCVRCLPAFIHGAH